jgi:hypothetical protein
VRHLVIKHSKKPNDVFKFLAMEIMLLPTCFQVGLSVLFHLCLDTCDTNSNGVEESLPEWVVSH